MDPYQEAIHLIENLMGKYNDYPSFYFVCIS